MCGLGYTFDWGAISSIATVMAVIVALWLAAQDRRDRVIEKMESQARAASVVSLTLSGVSDTLKSVLVHMKETNGLTLNAPGTDVLYAVDLCQRIVEREAFFHQLPTPYLQQAELVVSLSRRWLHDIQCRRGIQANSELKNIINWQNIEGIERVGNILVGHAAQLHAKCMQTRDLFERKQIGFFKSLKSVARHALGRGVE